MSEIRQVRYNKINCVGCGSSTRADLVAFDFGKLFRFAIFSDLAENKWEVLGRLDLKFYYTIRDICQELKYDLNIKHSTTLRLTVRNVIRQIEFLMDDMPFKEIMKKNRNSEFYNTLYGRIDSTYGTVDEKMEAIEKLFKCLATSNEKEVIVEIPVKIELNHDEDGKAIPVKVFYYDNKEKIELEDRVCPVCGMKMDSQAGYRNEYIIGLAGLARVGKTAFIASLIHQLKKLDKEGFIHLKTENSDSLRKFEQEFVAEYEKGNIIRKTEVENTSMIPLVYLPLQIKDREYNFIFVDMPGEIYSGSDSDGLDFVMNKRVIMRNADVVWCCIEPSMIDAQYRNKNVELKKEDSSKQLSSLIKLMRFMYDEKLPASVVLTQSDLIKDYPLFRPEKDVISEYLLPDNSLDWTKTEEFIDETRNFIKQMNNFELSIEGVFEGLTMFSIASYGFDVSAKAVLSSQEIQPSMVELPFLWTLAKLDLIPVTRLTKTKAFLREKTVAEKIVDSKELYIK